MLTDGQILNTQPNKYHKLSPERIAGLVVTQKGAEKLQTADSSFSDLSQDLIKELALKNKLLNAQLVEYRTLVANLNARLQQSGEENKKLSELLNQREQQERKLHTIQEELNSMSEITTKSRRRDCEESREEYYFHQISQLLNLYQLLPDSMNWNSYIETIEAVLEERRQMAGFIGRVREMREMIEPGESDLHHLWDWLKRVGLNYCYLVQHSHRARAKKYIQQ